MAASTQPLGATYGDLVAEALTRHSDQDDAFVMGECRVSCREARTTVARFMTAFQARGVGRGSAVAGLGPNSPEAWMAQAAAFLLGSSYTGLQLLGALDEHVFVCRDAEAAVLVVDRSLAEHGRKLLARRPLIIAGDGVYWSDASKELIEFAKLANIPTCTRRTARGALPESNPLAFTPSFRRGFIENADVICLIGQQVTRLDELYEPPDFSPATHWIQVQETADDLWYGMPTDLAVVGSSELVLQQMTDLARTADPAMFADRSDWVGQLARVREKLRQATETKLTQARELHPIHPRVLCAELAAAVDDDATLIYDSFTASSYLTTAIEANLPGTMLDAGLFQTLGHSIGMAFGAQLARAGRQVVSLIGDGGFGIAGIDMESLVRYGLPATVVLYNNSSWGGRAWGHDLYYPKRASGELSKDIRYDEMFKWVGCHTEFVTKPDEIRPALERSFGSGKPSLVNVIGETTETSAFRARYNLIDVWTRQNFDELPNEAQEEIRAWGRSTFERISKHARDSYGFDIPAEELAQMAGVEPDDE